MVVHCDCVSLSNKYDANAHSVTTIPASTPPSTAVKPTNNEEDMATLPIAPLSLSAVEVLVEADDVDDDVVPVPELVLVREFVPKNQVRPTQRKEE